MGTFSFLYVFVVVCAWVVKSSKEDSVPIKGIWFLGEEYAPMKWKIVVLKNDMQGGSYENNPKIMSRESCASAGELLPMKGEGVPEVIGDI